MSSRDSGHWHHLSKLRRNLNECTNRKTTVSRPESVKWNNVILFFHKRWWLKNKKFPNRRTVLTSVWSERCGITSRRFWPAVYWKISAWLDVFFFVGRESFMSMSSVCLQGKKRDVRVLSLPRTRNILIAKTEFITLKNYVFFFLKALVSSTIKCS